MYCTHFYIEMISVHVIYLFYNKLTSVCACHHLCVFFYHYSHSHIILSTFYFYGTNGCSLLAMESSTTEFRSLVFMKLFSVSCFSHKSSRSSDLTFGEKSEKKWETSFMENVHWRSDLHVRFQMKAKKRTIIQFEWETMTLNAIRYTPSNWAWK